MPGPLEVLLIVSIWGGRGGRKEKRDGKSNESYFFALFLLLVGGAAGGDCRLLLVCGDGADDDWPGRGLSRNSEKHWSGAWTI